MGELTVIFLSLGMVILCWIVARVNDKVDRQIRRFKKLENALIKNSTRGIEIGKNRGEADMVDAPLAQSSRDKQSQGLNYIAKR